MWIFLPTPQTRQRLCGSTTQKHTALKFRNNTRRMKAGTRGDRHAANRLISKQHGLDSNGVTLGLCEHIPKGTSNIVAFWQTVCQNLSVYRGGDMSQQKVLRGSALRWGWNLLNVLEGCTTSRTSLHLSAMSARAAPVKLSTALRTNPWPKIGVFCLGRGRDKLMRRLSEKRLKLRLFVWAAISHKLLIEKWEGCSVL